MKTDGSVQSQSMGRLLNEDAEDISVRTLVRAELRTAAELIQLTNDDAEHSALEADLEECMAKWPEIHLGAFDRAGTMVGAIAGRLDRVNPLTGWSDDIVILPQYRGSGAGKLLLRAQVEGFRRLGCTRVCGRSPARLFGSIGFFERHGFRVVERTTAQGIWGIKDGEPLCITELLLSVPG